jgi:hypothetical protein
MTSREQRERDNARADALNNRIKYSDPQDPWEMLETPWGNMPAWKASTIASGTMGAYDSFVKQAKVAAAVINDSLDAREQEIVAREQALTARESAVIDLIGNASAMCDRIMKRLDEEEERQRELEEEEPVEDPPGMEEVLSDEGDLEALAAKDPDDPAQLPGGPVEPDEDAGEVLQQAPTPPPVSAFMQERPTEIEE